MSMLSLSALMIVPQMGACSCVSGLCMPGPAASLWLMPLPATMVGDCAAMAVRTPAAVISAAMPMAVMVLLFFLILSISLSVIMVRHEHMTWHMFSAASFWLQDHTAFLHAPIVYQRGILITIDYCERFS